MAKRNMIPLIIAGPRFRKESTNFRPQRTSVPTFDLKVGTLLEDVRAVIRKYHKQGKRPLNKQFFPELQADGFNIDKRLRRHLNTSMDQEITAIFGPRGKA
jgi:hypothetical protein